MSFSPKKSDFSPNLAWNPLTNLWRHFFMVFPENRTELCKCKAGRSTTYVSFLYILAVLKSCDDIYVHHHKNKKKSVSNEENIQICIFYTLNTR